MRQQLTNISHPSKCVSLKLLTGKNFLKSKDIRTKDPLIEKKDTHLAPRFLDAYLSAKGNDPATG